MGGGFTLEPREGYLYVQLEPGYEINPENLSRLYSAMSESCRANGLTKTLTVGDGVTRNLTPVESTDFAWTLFGIGVLHEERGETSDAASYFCSALEILRRVRPPGHFLIANAERRLAAVGIAVAVSGGE